MLLWQNKPIPKQLHQQRLNFQRVFLAKITNVWAWHVISIEFLDIRTFMLVQTWRMIFEIWGGRGVIAIFKNSWSKRCTLMWQSQEREPKLSSDIFCLHWHCWCAADLRTSFPIQQIQTKGSFPFTLVKR